MPAIRGVYTTHPSTGLPGFWLELSTSPPGTLTGLAQTAFPATGTQTLAQYQAALQSALQNLYLLPGAGFFGVVPPGYFVGTDGLLHPMIVQITVAVTSLVPLVFSVVVGEGAIKQVRLN